MTYEAAFGDASLTLRPVAHLVDPLNELREAHLEDSAREPWRNFALIDRQDVLMQILPELLQSLLPFGARSHHLGQDVPFDEAVERFERLLSFLSVA